MGSMQAVNSETARKARSIELKARDRDRNLQAEEEKANRDFVQVYPKGWKRIQALMRVNKTAAQIYAFLAEHIDASCGAVVCTQHLIAEEFGIHERTVRRAIDFLEESRALVVIKLGTANAYCLSPEEVWKSWDSSKKNAAFVTKTLARKAENEQVRRKLQVMMHEGDKDD